MGVGVWGLDENRMVVFQAYPGPYGVDGTAVFTSPTGSSRKDLFTQRLAPAEAAKVTQLLVWQYHAPRSRIVEIINQPGKLVRDIRGAVNDFCEKNPDVCEFLKAAAAALIG